MLQRALQLGLLPPHLNEVGSLARGGCRRRRRWEAALALVLGAQLFQGKDVRGEPRDASAAAPLARLAVL